MTHQVHLCVPLGHPHSPAPTLGLAQLWAAVLTRITSQIKKTPLTPPSWQKSSHQASLHSFVFGGGEKERQGTEETFGYLSLFTKRAPITLLGAPASSTGSLPKPSYVFSGRQRKKISSMEKPTASYPDRNWEPVKGYRLIQNSKYTCYHGSYIFKVGTVQTGLSKCIITKTQRKTELPALLLMTFIQHLGGWTNETFNKQALTAGSEHLLDCLAVSNQKARAHHDRPQWRLRQKKCFTCSNTSTHVKVWWNRKMVPHLQMQRLQTLAPR